MTFRTILNNIMLLGFLIVFMVWLWQFFSPYDIHHPIMDENNIPIENDSPTLLHPLGTDIYGVDILVKLSEAISYNLYLSLTTLITFLLFGTIIGIGLGFKPTHERLSQIKYLLKNKRLLSLRLFQWIGYLLNNIFQTFPIILVMIVTILTVQRYVSQPELRLFIDMAILGIFSSPKLAITLEDRIINLKKEEFIIAAKAMGMSYKRLIFKHILWYECRGIIIVHSLNIILQAIMMEIFLTYYNYGSNQLSLGVLLKNNMELLSMYRYLDTQEILTGLIPFIFIVLFSLTFRWLGERFLEILES